MKDPAPDPAAELRALYEAKARAELRDSDALLKGAGAVRWSGDPIGRVMLVKGLPDAEDLEACSAFAGPDGEAARKALEALRIDPASALFTVSRPAEGAQAEAVVSRIRLQIEAVDPAVVVATDREAAEDVAAALGLRGLAAGRPVRTGQRTLLALSGLRASLADPKRKRAVWGQLKTLAK